MDVDMMKCEELKEEIITMLQMIDDAGLLEQIYHFVKNLLKMEELND